MFIIWMSDLTLWQVRPWGISKAPVVSAAHFVENEPFAARLRP